MQSRDFWSADSRFLHAWHQQYHNWEKIFVKDSFLVLLRQRDPPGKKTEKQLFLIHDSSQLKTSTKTNFKANNLQYLPKNSCLLSSP